MCDIQVQSTQDRHIHRRRGMWHPRIQRASGKLFLWTHAAAVRVKASIQKSSDCHHAEGRCYCRVQAVVPVSFDVQDPKGVSLFEGYPVIAWCCASALVRVCLEAPFSVLVALFAEERNGLSLHVWLTQVCFCRGNIPAAAARASQMYTWI